MTSQVMRNSQGASSRESLDLKPLPAIGSRFPSDETITNKVEPLTQLKDQLSSITLKESTPSIIISDTSNNFHPPQPRSSTDFIPSSPSGDGRKILRDSIGKIGVFKTKGVSMAKTLTKTNEEQGGVPTRPTLSAKRTSGSSSATLTPSVQENVPAPYEPAHKRLIRRLSNTWQMMQNAFPMRRAETANNSASPDASPTKSGATAKMLSFRQSLSNIGNFGKKMFGGAKDEPGTGDSDDIEPNPVQDTQEDAAAVNSKSKPSAQSQFLNLASFKSTAPEKNQPGKYNLVDKPLPIVKRSLSTNDLGKVKSPALVVPSVPKLDETAARLQDVVSLLKGKTPLPQKFKDEFVIGQLLGDGAFGFVMSAVSISDGVEVAVKFITKAKVAAELWTVDSMDPSKRILKEIDLLRKLDHPGIIKYIAHWMDAGKYIILITELHGTEWEASNPRLTKEKCPHLKFDLKPKSAPNSHALPHNMPLDAKKAILEQQSEFSPLLKLTPAQEKQIQRRTSCDLFECIDAHKRIPEKTAKYIFAQIALAVKYLHDSNIVHKDIKDENIVIDENYTIKIIDFGSAAFIPSHPSQYFTKFNGTTHFASPEIAAGKVFKGPEAEMWALGVLLYTIVYGENPFTGTTQILKGAYVHPYRLESDTDPLGCRNLLSRLLEFESERRATIEEILEHPWMKSEVERLQQTNELK